VARSRRKFSPQFKAEAVQFVIETGRPVAEVARELEINEGTLGNWVNQWKADNPEPEKALTPVERARVAEMEDEIRKLRMENEFLKKAALSSRGRRNTGLMDSGRVLGWRRSVDRVCQMSKSVKCGDAGRKGRISVR
jgi:transposase-like protein